MNDTLERLPDLDAMSREETAESVTQEPIRFLKIPVYLYASLSDKAKDRARQNYRENFDDDWSESVEDTIKETLGLAGIEVSRIYYSISYCQGDGGCFASFYGGEPIDLLKIKAHRPEDLTLHTLLARLERERVKELPDVCEVRTEHRGSSYYHEHMMEIEISNKAISYDGELLSIYRGLARWAYALLVKEYEFLTSDEVIAEYYTDYNHEFLENGDPL